MRFLKEVRNNRWESNNGDYIWKDDFGYYQVFVGDTVEVASTLMDAINILNNPKHYKRILEEKIETLGKSAFEAVAANLPKDQFVDDFSCGEDRFRFTVFKSAADCDLKVVKPCYFEYDNTQEDTVEEQVEAAINRWIEK